MKKSIHFFIIVFFCYLFVTAASKTSHEALFDVFPDINGFQKKGLPESFQPDTLFEYINGAAEVYLSYDFQKLVTLTYENDKKQSLTIDIYQQSNANTGFGIYSQEKSAGGNFVSIGTQGYYEKGTLNFFKDKYYIKLSGFDLQEEDQSILEKSANLISNKLEGNPSFPIALSCFPDRGKIKNSERFILKNFLGHSFLHSAFVCDYQTGQLQFQIFIIQTENEPEADTILKKYGEFLKKKGIDFHPDDSGIYRFQDPYYGSRGEMNLEKQSTFIWGLFSDDSQLSQFYLHSIEQALKSSRLTKKGALKKDN